MPNMKPMSGGSGKRRPLWLMSLSCGIACWEIHEKNECIRQLMHFFCDLGMTSKRIAKIRLKRLFKQALLCYPIEEAVELDVFCPAWCISSRSDRYDIA